jgi:hypothetical protein
LLTPGDLKMMHWPKIVFAFRSRTAATPPAYFDLPSNAVVELSAQVQFQALFPSPRKRSDLPIDRLFQRKKISIHCGSYFFVSLLLSNSLKSSGDWRGQDASSTLWIRSNPFGWKIMKERSKER